MRTFKQGIRLSTAAISLAMLAGCLEGTPPTESDVAALSLNRLQMNNALNSWKPVKAQAANLKCNRSGDVYACSFDLQGKMQQVDYINGVVKQKDFAYKAQTGKFQKAGDVWTLAP